MLRAQIIALFSKPRLQSYNNDLGKHFENLDLIAKLTPNLEVMTTIAPDK